MGFARQLIASISDDEFEWFRQHWRLLGRRSQKPPAGDWTTWLLIGGRGSGKTRAGAEWVRQLAAEGVAPIALVSETITEAVSVMVRGPSGILAVSREEERPILRDNMLIWTTGAEALLLGASDPDRFRGPQFAAAWCDELGKWPHAEAAWDMLQFGLRLGERPRQLVTTTPRPTKLLKRLMAEPGTVTVRMTTRENERWLASAFLKAIVARYEHTVLGRQELEGELIEDRPDALWRREMFRRDEGAELGRIVVAVDPPATGRKSSDACGIVVAGRSGNGAVVLADMSFGPARPEQWARAAVAAFHEFGADCIGAETGEGCRPPRPQIPRTRGSPPPSISSVSAHTSASTRSGECPSAIPSAPNAHISSSSAVSPSRCTTRPLA